MKDHNENVLTALKNFKPIDNLPRDIEQEANIILENKASFLLRQAIINGTVAPLMGTGRYNGSELTIPLKTPIRFCLEIRLPNSYSECRMAFDTVVLGRADKEMEMSHSLGWVCRPCLQEPPMRVRRLTDDKLFDIVPTFLDMPRISAAALEALSQYGLATILNMCSEYVTVLRILRYFGMPTSPYAPSESRGGKTRSQAFRDYDVDCGVMSATGKQECSLAELEDCIASIIKYHREVPIDISLEATNHGFMSGAYPFRNEYGDVVQVLLKFHDWKAQRKLLVPATSWSEPYCIRQLQALVPLSGKQPLYNLNLIIANHKASVILTDSVEIADKNQACCRNGEVVWSSYISDCYDQVDWEPLKGRNVCLVVSNHSGFSLAEQYLRAKNLSDYLLGQEKLGVKLTYAQVVIEYPTRHEPFTDIEDYQHWWLSKGPEVIKDSIRVMTRYEFDQALQAAVASLQARPWWVDDNKAASSTPRSLEEGSGKLEAPPYLIRPVLSMGCIAFICAKKDLGKSSLTWSLCGMLISGKPVLKDAWWTVPSNVVGKTKILYCDMETPHALLERRMHDFFWPYLSNNEEERKEQYQNLKLLELESKAGVDFREQVYQDMILNEMRKLDEQGDRNVRTGLVIFDTYTRMTGGKEDPDSWKKLTPMIQAIQRQEAGVLILHHLNNDGEMCGFKEKMRSATEILHIVREGDEKGSLATPITMIPCTLKYSYGEADYAQFNYAVRGKQWQVVDHINDPKALFWYITEDYRLVGEYERGPVLQMFGMGHETYSKIRREAKPLLKLHPLVKTKAEKAKLEAKKVKEAEVAKKATDKAKKTSGKRSLTKVDAIDGKDDSKRKGMLPTNDGLED